MFPEWQLMFHPQEYLRCMRNQAQNSLQWRCAGTLEEQQAAAAAAKAEKEKILQKLKMYESKILKSEKDGGLVEIAKQKEEQLRRKREELERRCVMQPVTVCSKLNDKFF